MLLPFNVKRILVVEEFGMLQNHQIVLLSHEQQDVHTFSMQSPQNNRKEKEVFFSNYSELFNINYWWETKSSKISMHIKELGKYSV